MVFKVVNTWDNPAGPSGGQRGFPAPGSGAQAIGDATPQPQDRVVWKPERPTKGFFSWSRPSAPSNAQRGFPEGDAPEQHRPPGSMPNVPPVFGGVFYTETPYYDRGSEAFVPNFGYVLYNPIGAGIDVPYRTAASYGPAAEYHNGQIFWQSQQIPTSVGTTPLIPAGDLLEEVGPINIEAMLPVRRS